MNIRTRSVIVGAAFIVPLIISGVSLATAASADSANDNCGSYCPTLDMGVQGNGNAPVDGTVGNADSMNPQGQAPDGTDPNNGYECDNQTGVGNGNPAHTACSPSPSPSTSASPSPSPSKTVSPSPSNTSSPSASPSVSPSIIPPVVSPTPKASPSPSDIKPTESESPLPSPSIHTSSPEPVVCTTGPCGPPTASPAPLPCATNCLPYTGSNTGTLAAVSGEAMLLGLLCLMLANMIKQVQIYRKM